MNIVFLGLPVNTKSLPEHYKLILEMLTKAGHTVNQDYISSDYSDSQTRHKNILSQIKKADGVIAEGTEITPEMSRFITLSLQFRVPTLILYQKNDPEAFVFETSRLLSLKKYTEKNLKQRLDTFFNQINKNRLLYRFNLMMSKEMTTFVMDKSRQSKVSKADYIRNLILQDMSKK